MQGPEFAKALFSGELPTRPVELIGQAKKADDPNTVLFAPGMDADTWVPLPAKSIESVERMGSCPCRGKQAHPTVRIRLAQAVGEEGKVFEQLLSAFLSSEPEAPPPPPYANPPSSRGTCPECRESLLSDLEICWQLSYRQRGYCILVLTSGTLRVWRGVMATHTSVPNNNQTISRRWKRGVARS